MKDTEIDNRLNVRWSIKWKLMAAMAIVMLSLGVVLTFLQISSQKKLLGDELDRRIALMRENLVERGKAFTSTLAQQVENDLASFNFSAAAERVQSAAEDSEAIIGVSLMDSSGTALVDTLGHETIQQRLDNGGGKAPPGAQEVRIWEDTGGKAVGIIVTHPLQISTHPWGILRLIFSLEGLQEEIETSRLQIRSEINSIVYRSIVTGLSFIALSFLIVFVLTTRFTRPIIDLTRLARQFSMGNFSISAFEAGSRDEVGVLASAFIQMSRDLRASYQKLEEYNRTLEQRIAERTEELNQKNTQLNGAIEEISRAWEVAESANRYKSEFLANMSHEIRTPMNAVIGMAELASRTSLTARQRDYINKIKSSSQTLLGLINDILDFSKIEAGKLDLESATFDIRRVMSNVGDLLAAGAAEKGIELIVTTDGDVPHALVGDSLRLGQVLTNLTTNAVKFTHSGEVVVRAALDDSQSEHAQASPDKIRIKFSVRDTGIGIPRAEIPRLFDSFTQADGSTTREYGGTGLGLSICKRLVEMMGGEIRAESVPEKGSTFWFSLELELPPFRSEAGSGARKSADEFRTAKLLRGARILLVEDNAINRQVAREIMESSGIAVEEAITGREALERIRSTAEEGASYFDAVLMDVQMPEMDGFEASRAIRNDGRFEALPIIAMTAHAMKGDREKCLDAGMNDYVSKPIDPEELFSTLARWAHPVDEILAAEPPLPGSISTARQQHSIPVGLDGIDMESALKRLGGNWKLLKQIIAGFHTNHGSAAAEIEDALGRGDNDTARRIAHTIKGVAGNISAMELHIAAASLESAIAGGTKERIQESIGPFKESLTATLTSAEKLKETKERPRDEQNGLEVPAPHAGRLEREDGFDLPKVTHLIVQLDRMLRDGSFMAHECFYTLRENLKSSEFQAQMEELKGHMDIFDMAEGRAVLVKVASSLNISLDVADS